MLDRFIRKLKGYVRGQAPPRFLDQAYSDADVGAHSYGGLQVVSFGDDTTFSIGKYCSIAANVILVLGGEHRTDWVTTYPFSAIDPTFAGIEGHPASKGDIRIGNDVWIGRDSMIMSGVEIGDGAVIAARSLVTKDVPAYTIVGGHPAKVLKHRFSSEVVERLVEIKWWDWPEERVKRAVPMMLSDDVSGFLDAVEAGEI